MKKMSIIVVVVLVSLYASLALADSRVESSVTYKTSNTPGKMQAMDESQVIVITHPSIEVKIVVSTADPEYCFNTADAIFPSRRIANAVVMVEGEGKRFFLNEDGRLEWWPGEYPERYPLLSVEKNGGGGGGNWEKYNMFEKKFHISFLGLPGKYKISILVISNVLSNNCNIEDYKKIYSCNVQMP